MMHKLIHGKLQNVLKLLHLDFAARQLRRIERGLIVVTQKMRVIYRSMRRQCRLQQMLRKNHTRAEARTIGAVVAFTDTVEPIARSNHPCVVERTFQVFAKVFEDRRVLRRNGGEVVEGLIETSSQTCRSNVVTKNAAVHNLSVKRRLRKERFDQIGDILLTFRREGLLVTRAPAKGD